VSAEERYAWLEWAIRIGSGGALLFLLIALILQLRARFNDKRHQPKDGDNNS
jgi:hypothetical protein